MRRRPTATTATALTRFLPAGNPDSPDVRREPHGDVPEVPFPRQRLSFASFDPHVNYHDPHGSPIVYWVYRVLLTLLLLYVRVLRAARRFLVCAGVGGGVPGRPAERACARPQGLRSVCARASPRARRAAVVVSRLGLDRLAAEVQSYGVGQGGGQFHRRL